MSWKFIFNTNHLVAGTDRKEALRIIEMSKYRFYNWNGTIYTCDGMDTGITTDDCF